MAIQVEQFGKRRFAFGVRWIAAVDSPQEDIADALGDGSTDGLNVYYVKAGVKPKSRLHVGKHAEVLPGSDDSALLGFVAGQKLRGSIGAAGDALAASASDGIYVAELSSGDWWYCGVRGGLVIPSTDVIERADVVKSKALQLGDGLDLPVFASGEVFQGAESFDLPAVLGQARVRPLRALTGKGVIIRPLVAVAVVGAVALYGYRVMVPPEPTYSPAETLAMARANYVSSVSGEVGAWPVSSNWPVIAYRQAHHRLPPYIAGWQLEGLACTPGSCEALYKVAGGLIYASTPLRERFGTALSFNADGRSAKVSLPLNTPLAPINAPYLRTLPAPSIPLIDWVGRAPVAFDGATVEGQPVTRKLGVQMGASAAELPPLVMEQVSVAKQDSLDALSLQTMVAAGSRGGFVPQRFVWSSGSGSQRAAWKMVWARLHN